jgi:hypothetical protein
MTANREVYEGNILETLIKNSERLAVIENKFDQLETKLDERFDLVNNRFDRLDTKLNWLFGAVFAVGAGILATLYVQPILNALG